MNYKFLLNQGHVDRTEKSHRCYPYFCILVYAAFICYNNFAFVIKSLKHDPKIQEPLTRDTSYHEKSALRIVLQVRQSTARPPVRSIINPLKLVDCLSIQADEQCSVKHM